MMPSRPHEGPLGSRHLFPETGESLAGVQPLLSLRAVLITPSVPGCTASVCLVPARLIMALPLRFDGRVVLVTGAGGGKPRAGPTVPMAGLRRAAARGGAGGGSGGTRVGRARRGTGRTGTLTMQAGAPESPAGMERPRPTTFPGEMSAG